MKNMQYIWVIILYGAIGLVLMYTGLIRQLSYYQMHAGINYFLIVLGCSIFLRTIDICVGNLKFANYSLSIGSCFTILGWLGVYYYFDTLNYRSYGVSLLLAVIGLFICIRVLISLWLKYRNLKEE